MISVDEKELLAERLVTGNLHKIRLLVGGLEPDVLAEIINSSKHIDYPKVFRVLEPEKAIKTFEHLDFDIQNELLDSFPSEQLSETLNKISPRRPDGIF
jgi:Mg/Co/Ni transporter MgtE